MPLPAWARFILNVLSAGELQYGTSFDIPVQISSKLKPGYTVQMGSKFIKGTGIPASTMQKFQMGIWIPRQRTLSKLKKLYGRFQYQRLKQAGASPKIANKLRYKTPREVDKNVKKYREYVRKVAQEKGVDPLYIQWGFMQSGKDQDEWDIYISEKIS